MGERKTICSLGKQHTKSNGYSYFLLSNSYETLKLAPLFITSIADESWCLFMIDNQLVALFKRRQWPFAWGHPR
jgi:hypothetical protein